MKKKLFIIGVLILACLLPQHVDAQILKGFGRKVVKKLEDQINRRVERQADKAINKGLDKVENAAEGAVKGGAGSQSDPAVAGMPDMDGMLSSSNVTLPDIYDFKMGIAYQMKSGKEKPVDMEMWFGAEDYLGMTTPAQKDMFMVMHGANMVAFMEKEKSYMVLGGAMAERILGKAIEESEEGEEVNFAIKKIGSERVLDYQCDVYEVRTDEYVTKLWMTEDLDLVSANFMQAFARLAKSNLPSGGIRNMGQQTGGVLIKMEGQEINGKDAMSMVATSISKQGKQIRTKEYKSFGF